jgi:hypothetical protein
LPLEQKGGRINSKWRPHKTQKEGVPQRHKAVSEHPLSAYPFAQNCYEFI